MTSGAFKDLPIFQSFVMNEDTQFSTALLCLLQQFFTS